jgi:hypothetical protein
MGRHKDQRQRKTEVPVTLYITYYIIRQFLQEPHGITSQKTTFFIGIYLLPSSQCFPPLIVIIVSRYSSLAD